MARVAHDAEVTSLKGTIQDKSKLNDELREKNKGLSEELRRVRAELDLKEQVAYGAAQTKSAAESRSRRSEVESSFERSRRVEAEDALRASRKSAQSAEDKVHALQGTIRKLLIELEEFVPDAASKFGLE